MPREEREVCAVPSSLVLRLVWEKFALNSRVGVGVGAGAGAGAGLGSIGPSPSASQMVTSNVVADAGYLAALLRQAIEGQALLEHFALVEGLSDGWE